jgi:uncharacterized protein DUF1592/uncharacterized protein DUF1588/uncharacterized protein DUF1595/uncharacterized protein DUF1585/uncharacterized protein DUF1587
VERRNGGASDSSWRAAALGGALLALLGCGGRALHGADDKPGGISSAGGKAGSSGAPTSGRAGVSGDYSGGGPPGGAAGASSSGGAPEDNGGTDGTETTLRVTDVAALSAACDPSTIHPGPSPLRRLNHFEYDNTVRDLTGLAASPTTGLPFSHEFPPELTSIVASDTEAIDPMRAAAYREAADEIAAEVATAEAARASGCDLAAMDEMTCATAFIESFGKHAFRRPLTDEEVTQYQGVFTEGSSGATYEDGLALIVTQMLQSRNFLYRIEVGAPTPGVTAVPLTGYELATRLSYFLWGSMPDAALFAAADAGALSTVEQLTAQAKRMLASPSAHTAASEFHRRWLGWSGIVYVGKSPTAFPTWTPRLAEGLLNEALRFGDDVFWNDGRLVTFLTAPYSFMDGVVAKHYGLSVPSGDGTFVKVALDPSQRSGILTLGAFLAGFGGQTTTNPVLRGSYIRERLLCAPVPPEPPEISASPPPDLPPDPTTRQRFEALDSAPACTTCHQLMDPLGFGLENFDAVGNWRVKDAGAEVDASGSIVGALDPATNGPFRGPAELAQKLASSGDVRACVAAQWFRWANGRQEVFPDDACSLLAVNQRFEAADYDMRVLPLAIITTDAFRYRSATAP